VFEKVLVANRGEIALRVVRACQELGVAAVAVYSDADESALHVRHADEAVRIGPPPAGKSYLDVEALIDAAKESGAEAVHPGYGFLAENAAFAAACREAGLTFVGPSAEAIEKMGNKSAARRLAREAKVPVVPGSDDASSADEAAETAGGIGYPIMVKAAAGGGGRGIRVAEDEDELRKAVQVARREAEAAFGDGTLYLEKLLVAPRHVEVQVMGDHEGNVIHLYERECSMQRRRQKVLEEAPSPGISLGVREKMAEAAVRLAREAGYANAGTVEFLVEDEEFYFIEMNTRIQVEHPVTEMLTGVDLVKEQIRIAAGDPLSLAQEDVPMVGHAMEFRINAEDPDQDFMPSPGEISRLEVPGGPGVRVDSAIYQGYQIPPFYDSLVGKLIVWALTREEAISRARRALREYRLEGIKTTIPLHLMLLKGEAFRSGEYHTGYLEELLNGD
jgi:acetyl-CoA carboxylase, biotin carboxylase subunit